MKKFLILAVILIVAIFVGCSNSADGTSTNGNDDGSTAILPQSVGVDPFKGNTYADSSTKYVFKTDNTLESYHLSNSQWQLYNVMAYTYNANTKILTASIKKVPSFDGQELWTKNEYLSNINNMTDEQISQNTGGLSRTQTIAIIDAQFNIVGYTKAEEETHNGSLCYSEREYYPENTSLNGSNQLIDFSNNDNVSVRIYPYALGDYIGEIRIPNSQGSTTEYDITSITASTVAAVLNNNTLNLTYTKSWSNGVITIVVTGADSSSQAVLGNQSCTLSTSSTKSYYQKQ